MKVGTSESSLGSHYLCVCADLALILRAWCLYLAGPLLPCLSLCFCLCLHMLMSLYLSLSLSNFAFWFQSVLSFLFSAAWWQFTTRERHAPYLRGIFTSWTQTSGVLKVHLNSAAHACVISLLYLHSKTERQINRKRRWWKFCKVSVCLRKFIRSATYLSRFEFHESRRALTSTARETGTWWKRWIGNKRGSKDWKRRREWGLAAGTGGGWEFGHSWCFTAR